MIYFVRKRMDYGCNCTAFSRYSKLVPEKWMIEQSKATVRRARDGDAAQISELIGHLGFVVAPELFSANLAGFVDRNLAPLVAQARENIAPVLAFARRRARYCQPP